MRKSALPESKSLKTFFVYTAIVLFFIFISLSVKAFFVIKASKFDGHHQFLLSVSKDQKVKQIIAFNPSQSEVSVLDIKGNLSVATANQQLGFIPDANADMGDTFDEEAGVSEVVRTMGFHYNSIKTDVTLFDIIRIAILSHKTLDKPEQEAVVTEGLVQNQSDIKNFFVDDAVSSENVSIQIVNATGESGVGKRLEHVLSGLGCNVVSITTSSKKEKTSKIQYFGESTYTMNKLKKILKFPVIAMENQQIADIIIVIGEDNKTPVIF